MDKLKEINQELSNISKKKEQLDPISEEYRECVTAEINLLGEQLIILKDMEQEIVKGIVKVCEKLPK